MDIHLITSDAPLLSALVKRIASEAPAQPWQIASTIHRDTRHTLASQVSELHEGLLLLETDGPTQVDWETLAHLTAHHPRLNVVLMSRDAHKEQLLAAMRAGVREVIPCPPDAATLQATLQRWTDLPDEAARSGPTAARQRGQLIAFMACKGGAGSTFLATGMAHLLATEFERPCAFIDMDLRYGDASFYLGQTGHPNTIADLATPAARLDSRLLASCMYAVAPGLQMLCAPPDMAAALPLQAHHVEKLLGLAGADHPLVVIDLPRHLEPAGVTALAMADVVYLVVDGTMAALRDAQRCLQFIQPRGCDPTKIRLIINKQSRQAPMDPKTVHAALGIPVRHQIPAQQAAVEECINLGLPMAQVHPHNPVTEALRKVAADLLDLPVPRASSWLSRWLGRSVHLHMPPTSGASLETRYP